MSREGGEARGSKGKSEGESRPQDQQEGGQEVLGG